MIKLNRLFTTESCKLPRQTKHDEVPQVNRGQSWFPATSHLWIELNFLVAVHLALPSSSLGYGWRSPLTSRPKLCKRGLGVLMGYVWSRLTSYSGYCGIYLLHVPLAGFIANLVSHLLLIFMPQLYKIEFVFQNFFPFSIPATNLPRNTWWNEIQSSIDSMSKGVSINFHPIANK